MSSKIVTLATDIKQAGQLDPLQINLQIARALALKYGLEMLDPLTPPFQADLLID